MLKTMIEAFDRTHIINLRERKDRRRGVIRELKRHGVRPGSHGVRFYTAERPPERGGFPTLGARGSFTSHAAVMRRALHDGLGSVLVMEDDLRIVDSAVDLYGRAVCERLRTEEWDIVYFGYLDPDPAPDDDLLVQWNGPTIGGHFYGVHGRILPRLVSFMDACRKRPPGHPAGGPTFRDGAFNLFREKNPDVRTLVVTPNLAGQRSSRTDLHDLEWFDRNALTRPLVDAARMVKNALTS